MTVESSKVMAVHVLHVVSGDLWAGAEVQVYNLVAAQQERNDVQVHVVVLNEGQLARALRNLKVPVNVIDESHTPTLLILLRLYRLIRYWHIDVVHTHRQKEHVIGALAARLSPMTHSIRTIHGAPENAVPRWDLRRRFARAMDRFVARHLQAATVTVSDELAKGTRRWLGSNRVHVIRNSIDLREPDRNVSSEIHNESSERSWIVVGFFGRLVPVKRLDLLIDIASLLAHECPGEFRFAIYGEGPERARLEDRVRDLGLSESVTFHGFVNDPVARMRDCDVFLITSDHEGLPTTVLEAMCCGLPVIARAVGGIPPVLGHGNYGTLVNSGEAAGFTQPLVEFLRNPEHYLSMADNAKQAVRQYSSERMATKYAGLYADVMNGRNQSTIVHPRQPRYSTRIPGDEQ